MYLTEYSFQLLNCLRINDFIHLNTLERTLRYLIKLHESLIFSKIPLLPLQALISRSKDYTLSSMQVNMIL